MRGSAFMEAHGTSRVWSKAAAGSERLGVVIGDVKLRGFPSLGLGFRVWGLGPSTLKSYDVRRCHYDLFAHGQIPE